MSDLFVEAYKTEIGYNEKVYLYYDSNIKHYHHISNINAATNDVARNSKWCVQCNKSYRFDNDSFATNKCIENTCYFCKECFTTPVLKEQHFNSKDWVGCMSCNCRCPDATCLEKHRKNCKGKIKRCNKCYRYVLAEHYEKHDCDEIYCTNCDVHYTKNEEHRCFIKPWNPIKKI